VLLDSGSGSHDLCVLRFVLSPEDVVLTTREKKRRFHLSPVSNPLPSCARPDISAPSNTPSQILKLAQLAQDHFWLY